MHLVVTWTDYENIKGWKEERKARPVGLSLGTGCLDTDFFCVNYHAVSKQEQVDQVDRKSSKSSRVVKSSTIRWSRSSRSPKQPSRSVRSTRSTTGSIVFPSKWGLIQRCADANILASTSVRVRRNTARSCPVSDRRLRTVGVRSYHHQCGQCTLFLCSSAQQTIAGSFLNRNRDFRW